MASDLVSPRRSREVLTSNGMSSGDLQRISAKGTREELGELRNQGFQDFPMKLAWYTCISSFQTTNTWCTGQTPVKPSLPLQGSSSGVNQL
jgi:hypothetical protein